MTNLSQTITIKARVQNIYYQDENNYLGIARTTTDKQKLTQAEARDVLIDREIPYKDILKVKIEYIELELPVEKVEEYITLEN